MPTILPVWRALLDKTKMGFVDQTCGLQCVPEVFSAQLLSAKRRSST